MHCSSPRASSGLIIELRSSEPSAPPRADKRVQLVDEEDDVAAGALDLVEDALDAAFELAAIFRPGDERAERERQHALLPQRLRHVAARDALREPFDDRGLADTGLADEHRVVLAAPRQDRDHPLDLVVASDHRVELVLACRSVRSREYCDSVDAPRTCGRNPSAAARRRRRLVAARIVAPVRGVERDGGAAEERGGRGGDAEHGERCAAPFARARFADSASTQRPERRA